MVRSEGGADASRVYPRQQARTRRFTLGIPRSITVARDGRILFLRSPAGGDPVTELWELRPGADGAPVERRLVDPRALGETDGADLPADERARRERAREMAGGVTAFATDRDATLAAFTLAGRLYTVDVAAAHVLEHPTAGPAFDPRPAPDGAAVAYVAGDGLHLVDLVGGPGAAGVTRPLLLEKGVVWGRAEFAAAEEMGRLRGMWWAAGGRRLAAARVDERAVGMWHLGDPASPWVTPTVHRYPAAGTANADVRLAVVDARDGRRVDVAWDRATFPYLARVSWDTNPLTLQVQSRDQRRALVLVADPDTGTTELARELSDRHWVELVLGVPAWSGTRLVTVEDCDDHGPGGSRALVVDGEVVTPAGLQVRAVVHADPQRVTFTGSEGDPTQVQVWEWDDGALTGPLDRDPGVHGAAADEAAIVTTRAALGGDAPSVTVRWRSEGTSHRLAVHADRPDVTPRPRRLVLGPRDLQGVLLVPEAGGDGPLPVVLDPYGGPHAQRVLAADGPFLTSQWLADQGFAVLVVDGRGSPGRGPLWEREVAGDLATPALEDQIDALHAAAETEPRLDLGRVGIRGWSFGGFLAALAVLRRPDVFRAAVAGAPVTDWRLYDTHYTERYLGLPDEQPDAYRVSSLVDADGRLVEAAPWGADPPALLLIHGLADDNVVAAHTLRLSSALLADGRPHTFVPLSGVTHMTPQEVVSERLLALQADFLATALGATRG